MRRTRLVSAIWIAFVLVSLLTPRFGFADTLNKGIGSDGTNEGDTYYVVGDPRFDDVLCGEGLIEVGQPGAVQEAAFLKFDLSSITDIGAQIQSVTLTLRCLNAYSGATVSVHEVSNNPETDVCLITGEPAHRPIPGSLLATTTVTTCGLALDHTWDGGAHGGSYDLVDWVQGIADGAANQGLVLQAGGTGQQVDFLSSNYMGGTYGPRLTVTYTTWGSGPLPDLVISAGPTPTFSCSTYAAGQTISWSVQVRNNGTVASAVCALGCYVDMQADMPGHLVASVPIPTLNPGAVYQASPSVTFDSGDAGTRYLNVMADYEALLEESDVDNNLASYGPFEIVATTGHVFLVGGGEYPTIQAAIDAASAGGTVWLTDGYYTGDGNRDLVFNGKAVTVRSQSGDAANCIIHCGGSPQAPHRGFRFGATDGSGALVDAITVEYGYAAKGGGIAYFGGSSRLTRIVVRQCQAQGPGGGVYVESGQPSMTDLVMEGNNAGGQYPPWGGGVAVWSGSATLTRAVFRDNWASCGGGIAASSSTSLYDCQFLGNHSSYGGGIYAKLNQAETLVVSGCVGTENTATNGGFLHNTTAYMTPVSMDGCRILRNSASAGGGIWTQGSPMTVTSSTFAGNSASGEGSAIWGRGLDLANSIVAFGTSGGAFGTGGLPVGNISCTNVFGNVGGDYVSVWQGFATINNNFSADPRFCYAANDDVSIWSDSPCAPANNPTCGLVGALGVGCNSTALDQAKLGSIWPWELYYEDGNANNCHDPGEAFSPDFVPGWVKTTDQSCWMASASNLLQYAGGGNQYTAWLQYGCNASPFADPWQGYLSAACGSLMTLDDAGCAVWGLEASGMPICGPIFTATSTGGPWNREPISWCQARLAEDHPVSLEFWWTGEGQEKGHALTLWSLNPAQHTMIVTDSDDGVDGPVALGFTYSGSIWTIQNLWERRSDATVRSAVSLGSGTGCRPDLVCDDISWQPSETRAGEPITVTIQVRNQGERLTPVSRTSLLVDGIPVSSSIETPKLFLGGAAPVTCVIPSLTRGTHTVRACADTQESIDEIDDTNNCREEILNVGPAAETDPPVITDVHLTPGSGPSGTSFQFTASVTDLASGVAPGTVRVEIEHPDEAIIAEVELVDDGTNGDATAGDGIYSGAWYSGGQPAGAYLVDIAACDQAIPTNCASLNNGAGFSLVPGSLPAGSVAAWGGDWAGQCNVPPPNASFVAVVAGATHTLGLKEDGSVLAWGDNSLGECIVPEPNTGFVAISANQHLSMGLKGDGSVVVWGSNDYGQCNVPAPNNGFVAIAAGGGHCLGLKANGSVVTWGNNANGQCSVPSPNAGFEHIAGGGNHSVGLKADGTVVAWGLNGDGQCSVPSPAGGFVSIAAGRAASLGVKTDGSIVVWGSNTYGERNVPAPNTDFVGGAVGAYHVLGLKADGSVVAWGANNEPDYGFGQCDVPAPNTGFVSVSAGRCHSVGLRGYVSGACCEPRGGCELTIAAGCLAPSIFQGEETACEPSNPCPIPPVGACCQSNGLCAVMFEVDCPASRIWQGANTSCDPNPCPIQDGSILAWGENGNGECDVPPPNAGFIAAAAGVSHNLGLKPDGTIVAWGYNEGGQCNVPDPDSGFVAVAAGMSHSLALKSDGTIVAWGNNDASQCSVPEPNSGFVAIAAGWSHSLGLKSDGTIVAWGYNGEGPTGRGDLALAGPVGPCDVPAPNADFVAVAAGESHSLGLKADGTVVAWGGNDEGQCDVPEPNAGFVAIACNRSHSLGLKADGTVVGWGANGAGQCEVPLPNADFVAIAAGMYNSLGMKTDGTIVAWGNNDSGQCTIPTPNTGFAAISAGGDHGLGLHGTMSGACCQPDANCTVTAPSGCPSPGTWHCAGSTCNPNPCPFPRGACCQPNGLCVVTIETDCPSPRVWHGSGTSCDPNPCPYEDGSIAAWGDNWAGQCDVPAPNAGFIAAAAGVSHNLGLKPDGAIVAWGSNESGQCNVPDPDSGFVAVAGGIAHSLGLKSDGTIVAWGDNGSGQCSVPEPDSGFAAIAAGWSHSLGLKSDGTIVAWGGNYNGECDVPAPNADFVAVAAGESHSLGLKADGTVVAWGQNYEGECNVPEPNAGFVAIACNRSHSLGLKSDGSVVAWGANWAGQCDVPAPNTGFVSVAAGNYHSLGLKSDGTIVAWGYNDSGQCSIPTPNTGFGVISAGNHSLGLHGALSGACCQPDASCTVTAPSGCPAPGMWHCAGSTCTPNPCPFPQGACCQWNGICAVTTEAHCAAPGVWQRESTSCEPNPCPVPPVGTCCQSTGICAVTFELDCPASRVWQGAGTSCDPNPCPIQDGSILAWGGNYSGQCDVPPPNAGFIAAAAGISHSLGLKPDGTIVAWGSNESGQCNVPDPDSGFVAVAGGIAHSLGLKSDGTIVAWGDNGSGQCSVPEPDSGFAAIAAGWSHSLGLKSDGTIVAWGYNGYGQCDVPAPNADFVAVAAGGWHSLGLKSDGTVVAWGGNDEGECDVPEPNAGFIGISCNRSHSLGLKSDGTITAWGANWTGQCDVPSPNADFVAIAAGMYHSLGLKSSGTIVAWGYNDSGQCSIPTPNTGIAVVSGGGDHSLGLHGVLSGACCQPDGACTVTIPSGCSSPGTWRGAGSTCTLNSCPYPQGACCLWNGLCALTTQTYCAAPRRWQGESTTCEPNPCPIPPIGTCCQSNGICAVTFEADCPASRVWEGDSVSCDPNPCPIEDGSIVAWGWNGDGECDIPAPNADFVAVAGDGAHSLGLKADGTIVAWGDSSAGQCDVPSPNADFVAVAMGEGHSLGLRSDGTIVAWGDSSAGLWNVPAPNAGFVAIAGGYLHSLGLRSDGTIAAWGSDYSGECDVPLPNSDFAAVTAGEFFSLGLKSDGTIVAWGYNGYGQCDVPAPNAGFVAVAGGKFFSLGLKSDGTIVTWGANWNGQCNVPSPNEGFVAVAGGGSHSLGLKADGTIVAWGNNGFGQCAVPAPNTRFAAISAGEYHSLALHGSFSGACCRPDGTCTVTTPTGCLPPGTWQGVGTLCGPTTCPVSAVDGALAGAFPLHIAAVPNPASGQSLIHYQIPRTTAVTVEIFGVSGVLLRRFVVGPRPAGSHSLRWDRRDDAGREVSSGIYLARITTWEGSQSGRVVLIK